MPEQSPGTLFNHCYLENWRRILGATRSGVVIAEEILNNYGHFEKHGPSWGYLILLYVFVQLSRIIVVCILYPFLRYFGYGLEWKETIILVWSGLRGAVALSLSLSVNGLFGFKEVGRSEEVRASAKSGQSDLTPQVGTLFVFFTGGTVFLTLIVNGSTTQFILHLLGMDKLSETKIRILNYTRYKMLNKALGAFGDLGDDEKLGPADWPTVRRYITCLNNLDEEQVHPHIVSESQHHLQATNLRDIRVRLLNGVQAAYWGMLEEGRITQNTARLLMCSVDKAMDVVSTEPLCDWKGLQSNAHFPSFYRFLQMSRLPQRLVTYFTVERLESACYICAAFLRAHEIAGRQLREFIGDSEIAYIVINESKEEGEEACKFLEHVRVAFPQVLRVVKTRQVAYSILKHLSDYVQNLEKVGILEEKEMIHLDGAVQMNEGVSSEAFELLLKLKPPSVCHTPRVPSRPHDARPLLLVQSEGRNMNIRVGSKEYAKLPSFPPLPTRREKVKVAEDNSSDESGGEEVIVRVDSPSTLFSAMKDHDFWQLLQ